MQNPVVVLEMDADIYEMKDSAERDAKRKGHRIGNWRLEGSTWKGQCLNEPCDGFVLIGPGPENGPRGVTVFCTNCLYDGLLFIH